MIMLKSVALLLAMNALAAVVQPTLVPSNNPHDFPEVTDPSQLPKLSRDECINFVASEFENFQMGTEMNKLVGESRTHYPDSIEDLLDYTPTPEYKDAMDKLANGNTCNGIFRLQYSLFFKPQCVEYCDDTKKFVLDLISARPDTKSRIELYYGCMFGLINIAPPKGESESEGSGSGSGSGKKD